MNKIIAIAIFPALCFFCGCTSSVKDPPKETNLEQRIEDIEKRVESIEKRFEEHEKLKKVW